MIIDKEVRDTVTLAVVKEGRLKHNTCGNKNKKKKM